MTKIAVTGGSGFIGSHVVDKLIENGYEVKVVDVKRPLRDDVEFENVNVCDLNSLKKALSDCENVYHLAAMADVNDILKEPVKSVEMNILATANVLECARLLGIKRVLFASTVWVYGGAGVSSIVNEDTYLHMPHINHVYTGTKLASEILCHNYNALYNVPFTILRFGIPYGPRARPQLVTSLFVSKAMNNEPITIDGDGSQHRPFLYVEDLAEGNVLALKDVAKNQVYNLCSEGEYTIREIAETVRELFPNVQITYGPKRPGDYSGKEVSPRKAERELGWKAKISLKEGILKYIDWLKKHQQLRA